jgi:DNA primase
MDSRNRRTQSDIYTEEQIRRVLNGIGVDVEAEFGNELIVYCPYHNNTRTPAGEISKEFGRFFCFGCQSTKGLDEFVMTISGRTYFEAIRYIKSKGQETDLTSVINKTLYSPPDFVPYDELLIKRLHNQAMESPRAVRYFEGRKITKESMAKFSLGYSENQDSVIVPMHNHENMCLGFVARTVEGKEFKNTPGLPKSKILFNLNRIKASNTVYVVESSFDAIRLDQVGFPAVATLGANVSVSQIRLLEKYFNNIVLIADNDEAGLIMAEKLIEKLGPMVTVINLDKKYKDIGDMDDESIRKLEFSFDSSITAMLK